MNPETDLHTVADVAEKTGESVRMIRYRITAGVIKAIKTRLGYLVTQEELQSYLDRRGPSNGRRYFYNNRLITDATENNKEVTKNEADSQQP